MIPMNNWAAQAVNKLEEEKKAVTGRMEEAMAGAVYTQLKTFCQQDEEFAQAVVQGGGFAECMRKVAADVRRGYISDLDAYKNAVQFYFPGAEVKMHLTIDLIGKAAGEDAPQAEPVAAQPTPAEEKPKIISLNLADFFG